MKFALIALALLLATPADAHRCHHTRDHINWRAWHATGKSPVVILREW
jgi:hypothetical protein